MTVPLIVVTGFLGAGKTTLINRLLARRRERNAPGKLGVIVNELGKVGIDGALLGGEATRQVELPGGCVCCVLGDQLDTTLLELVDGYPGLEAIVLETTGVAEPLGISWAIAREPVCHRVRLEAVVTLVDATSFLASRPLSASVDAQVEYADVVLVTKAELVEGADALEAREADEAEAVARTLAPRALIRRGSTEEHVAWLEALLADPVLPDGNVLKQRAAAGETGVPGFTEEPEHHVHTAECRHLDSPAAHGIDSTWVPVQGIVDLEELEDQLAELPPNYVRIKGILRAKAGDGDARWFAVHRVGPRVSSEPVSPGEPQAGRIVALGPGVDEAELARCVAVAASVVTR